MQTSAELGILSIQVTLGISCKIIPQSSKQDKCDQTAQEDNHHETVKNAKPVNLVLKKIILQITIKTRGKVFIRLVPMHRVSESQLLVSFCGHRVFGCEVRLKNSISIISYAQASVSEDVLRKGNLKKHKIYMTIKKKKKMYP